MAYRLFKHKAYDESLRRLPPSIQHKATWAQVLLGMRGRTPSVKGTRGLNARWRRTPVQGNHYYMWWIPRSEGVIAENGAERIDSNHAANTILIHSIRHHDETDQPLDVGSINDYEEIALAGLDPRYEEQFDLSRRLRSQPVSMATIKGLPGSGKTVSMLYLVKDLAQRPGIKNILYVTYSARLKRAARDFLLAQDDAISQAVTIRTLNEIEHSLTNLHVATDPFTELRDFARHVELQPAGSLGHWRKYPQTLYTEIRAHLLGKSFPPNYTLPSGTLQELLPRGVNLDAAAYGALRNLDLPTATIAYSFADRLRTGRFFQDQRAAQWALALLQKERLPNWLVNLDALVVDEVQDLTLVQIALLGELVRAHLRRPGQSAFIFTVAGDESQIVQPSGFDWGVTKEVLGEQIGLWPDEFEFHYQRRSPRNLAQLIDNTWRLYGHLPKAQRPSARRQAFAYDDGPAGENEGYGRVLVCAPAPFKDKAGWDALLTELADKPGRIIIDLSESLRVTLGGALGNRLAGEHDEIIFLPREIKGLERATVLIYGLNDVYAHALRLCNAHEDGNIARFEARRLFDEIRVALSRSTEKLVLLNEADAPVLAELGVHELPGVGALKWEALIDTLQMEDMSEIEVIEGYLDEVDDLFERGMWRQGCRRNRRAYDLAVQVGDLALQREVQEQYIRGHIDEADQFLSRADMHAAFAQNRTAHTLALAFGDPLLQDDVDDQYRRIGELIVEAVQTQLAQTADERARQQFESAYATIHMARTLASLIDLPAAQRALDEAITQLAWDWSATVAARAYTPAAALRVADLLAEAVAAMMRQADHEGAQVLQVLADRYHRLPEREHLSADQVSQLLAATENFLQLVKPLPVGGEVFVFAELWLQEAYANLHSHVALYHRWALLAQELTALNPDYDVDEQMWDLENRLNLLLERGKRTPEDIDVTRFQALVAIYHGDAQLAATTWEQLGELELAADFARDAGDLEHAYRLFHQAKTPTPEELATAVKAVRLLHQLHSKHRALRPAERRALLAELTTLQKILSSADELANDEWGKTINGE